VPVEGMRLGDGLVGATSCENMVLVVSPNASFVPEIRQGRVSVYLCKNCRYGTLDPLQWPQVYTARYPYFAAISMPVPPPHPHAPMWIPPQPSDFAPIRGAVIPTLGFLRPAFVEVLSLLVTKMSDRVQGYLSTVLERSADLLWHDLAMRQALERLRTMPASFFDQAFQVSELQRHWILADAYLRFHSPATDPARSGHVEATVGAWTCDPSVVQKLCSAGFPVWFVRPVTKVVGARIRRVVPCRRATNLCQEPLNDSGPIYKGLAGDQHLAVMLNSGHTYLDISLNAVVSPDYRIPASQADQAMGPIRGTGVLTSLHIHRSRPCEYCLPDHPSSHDLEQVIVDNPGPSQVHASYRRGRDKFEELDHPWMPKALRGWRRAMDALDRSGPPKEQVLRGYWIPEPALIVGPRDPRRVERYLMNWLRIRPIWLYLLRIPNAGTFRVAPQSWRSFLNNSSEDPKEHSDTRSSQCAQVITKLLKDFFPNSSYDLAPQAPVLWHQYNLTHVSDDLAPLILWEMFELGFRYELLAVDQYLRPRRTRQQEAAREDDLSRIFPSHTIHALSFLPTEQSGGLFAPMHQRRVQSLNAFREILLYWPGCPPDITNAKPLLGLETPEEIESVEFALATFYVTNFFNLFARAPLLPHLLP
ncbi:hypothetical protein C8Q76DRAFT_581338, partial [Earliella scabrosa]